MNILSLNIIVIIKNGFTPIDRPITLDQRQWNQIHVHKTAGNISDNQSREGGKRMK